MSDATERWKNNEEYRPPAETISEIACKVYIEKASAIGDALAAEVERLREENREVEEETESTFDYLNGLLHQCQVALDMRCGDSGKVGCQDTIHRIPEEITKRRDAYALKVAEAVREAARSVCYKRSGRACQCRICERIRDLDIVAILAEVPATLATPEDRRDAAPEHGAEEGK